MKTSYRLSDAIREEGFEVRIMKHPSRVRGGLGKGSKYMWARAYEDSKGRCGIAVKADCWDYAYSASHEIAEQRFGFKHTAYMFCDQCNILSRWVKKLAARS